MSESKKSEVIINTLASAGTGAIGATISALCPELSIPSATLTPIIGGALGWIINEAKEKAFSKREKKNLAKAIIIANDHVNEEATFLNEDWFARYVNIVRNVNSDDLLFIWGKVLSCECNNPESVSLRTMETISNLSREEAELFQKVIPFTFFKSGEEPAIPYSKCLKNYGIEYGHILFLIDAGLLSNEAAISFNVESGKRACFASQKHLILIEGKQESEKKINIDVFPFTRAGKELLKIISWNENLDFINELCGEFNKTYASAASFGVKEIIKLDKGKGIYFR